MTSSGALEIEILRRTRELESIEEAWVSCYRSDPAASPFASHAWTSCVARHLAPEGALRVAVVRWNGQDIAILPMAVSRKKVALRSGAVAVPAPTCLHWAADLYWRGGSFSTSNSAIAHPSALDLPIVTSVLQTLAADEPFSFARLEDVPSAQARRPFYAQPADGAELRIDPAVERDSIQIRLARTWGD